MTHAGDPKSVVGAVGDAVEEVGALRFKSLEDLLVAPDDIEHLDAGDRAAEGDRVRIHIVAIVL